MWDPGPPLQPQPPAPQDLTWTDDLHMIVGDSPPRNSPARSVDYPRVRFSGDRPEAPFWVPVNDQFERQVLPQSGTIAQSPSHFLSHPLKGMASQERLPAVAGAQCRKPKDEASRRRNLRMPAQTRRRTPLFTRRNRNSVSQYCKRVGARGRKPCSISEIVTTR